MDLRHLRYFITVAEELNVTRAAKRLHISQPSLSLRVHKLEQEVGASLFDRIGRNIRLTQAGRLFLGEARKVIADADRGVALARRAASGETGQLTIGYNAPAAFKVFPKVIPAFRRRWPNIHLTFHSLLSPQQFDALRREELDVGFVWLPLPTDEFEAEKLIEEPLVAVLPADHRLAAAKSVRIRDLSGEPIILPSRDLHPDTYREIEQRFAQAGATLNVAYQLENSLSMINFVAMGIGCSLLPDYASSIRHDGVVYRPLRPANFKKTLVIVRRKDRSDLAETFVRFTLEHLPGVTGKAPKRTGDR
jgi:LysR family hca operon transcriptional activator